MNCRLVLARVDADSPSAHCGWAESGAAARIRHRRRIADVTHAAHMLVTNLRDNRYYTLKHRPLRSRSGRGRQARTRAG